MSQSTMQVMHARDMQKTSGRQKILKALGQAGIYLFLIVMAATMKDRQMLLVTALSCAGGAPPALRILSQVDQYSSTISWVGP